MTLVIALAMMVFALPLVVVPAAHALDIPDGTLTWVGFYPGLGYSVRLVDNSGTYWTGERTFYLSSELGNAGLAIALTAYSNDKPVWVRLASGASNSLILIIHAK